MQFFMVPAMMAAAEKRRRQLGQTENEQQRGKPRRGDLVGEKRVFLIVARLVVRHLSRLRSQLNSKPDDGSGGLHVARFLAGLGLKGNLKKRRPRRGLFARGSKTCFAHYCHYPGDWA
jgi:hypothetical protein